MIIDKPPSPVNAGPFLPTGDSCLKRICGSLALSKTDVFLDLGCGDGRVVKAVADRFKCRSIGVEYDQQVLETGLVEQGICESSELPMRKLEGKDFSGNRSVTTSSGSSSSSNVEFICCDMFMLLEHQSDSESTTPTSGVSTSSTATTEIATSSASVLTTSNCTFDSIQSMKKFLNDEVTVMFVYLLPEMHNMLAPFFIQKFSSGGLQKVIAFWWPIEGLQGAEEIIIENQTQDSRDNSRTFVYSRKQFESFQNYYDRDSI